MREYVLTRYSATTGGLAAGGTGGFIAVYIASCFVYFPIVLSLAEMSSIAPTAGGQYREHSRRELHRRVKANASRLDIRIFASEGAEVCQLHRRLAFDIVLALRRDERHVLDWTDGSRSDAHQ